MHFKSDNTAGISQEILYAIIEANQNYAEPYGKDSYTEKLNEKFSEVFETETVCFLTSTGTAANALALSAIVAPYGSILCHQSAHIYTDECSAPSFFTGGAKLILIDGENGKINPDSLRKSLSGLSAGFPRENLPSAISLAQGTEKGTVYSCDELKELSKIAQSNGMRVHMDGARFANALVSLNETPADLTWKSGVDVLCFGATKNGAMAAEAVVFFKKDLARNFEFLHKRAGQTFSKNRFFAAQFLASFKNGLWLKNGVHANRMARYLASRLEELKVGHLLFPVDINELFVSLPMPLISYLTQRGVKFYSQQNHCRFVTSFETQKQEIDQFIKLIENYTDRRFEGASLELPLFTLAQ